MMFKRVMVLGAVASALVFSGCQDRNRERQYRGTASDQTQPATGGSGTSSGGSTLPGSSDTLGGTQQEEQPGTELGGTGDQGGVGGSGTKKGGKKGAGAMDAGTPGGSDAGM